MILKKAPGLGSALARTCLLGVIFGIASFDSLAASSEWARPGSDGNLIYKTTPAGDRIMDFSTAGYMGGGVALPMVPVQRTVLPSGGADDSDAIQAAIDAVSRLPMENGFHGAVMLGAGTFICSKTIYLATSGVVLRGSGTNSTTIKMTGQRHSAIVIGRARGRGGPSIDENEPADGAGSAASRAFVGAETTIADAYVPSGTASFTVADARGFAVGDLIAIRRPTTAAWIRLMQMDDLKRDGRRQTWIGQSRSEVTQRRITAISGSKFTIDASLSDSYDAKYLSPPGVTVTKVKPASAPSQIGVENLHIQCPPLEISYGQAPYSAIRIAGEDCWVDDVYCEETMNSTAISGARITLRRVVVTHTFPNLGASKPTDFSIEG